MNIMNKNILQGTAELREAFKKQETIQALCQLIISSNNSQVFFIYYYYYYYYYYVYIHIYFMNILFIL